MPDRLWRRWLVVILLFLVGTHVAIADDGALREAFDNGQWRVESQAYWAVYSRKTEREGDKYVSVFVEYEMPVSPHFTVGLRGYPAFYFDPHKDVDAVFGVGLGASTRYYLADADYHGWYLEGAASGLYQSDYFQKNGSRFNFMLEFGGGYKFQNNWNVAIKYGHISNAHIASDNAGLNSFGLGIGYTF